MLTCFCLKATSATSLVTLGSIVELSINREPGEMALKTPLSGLQYTYLVLAKIIKSISTDLPDLIIPRKHCYDSTDLTGEFSD
jgi:hypothetical protein